MSKKWTLQNAVKRFTPHQKASLKRNKGNLNTHEFDSLIKEMNCYYEETKVEGKGRDRIIFTDKKRKEKVEKEDKRQFNKGIAPPHSKHLALMIMSKMDGIDTNARTRNGWATYFGVISPVEQDIMKGIYSEEVLKPYKEYMIRLGILADGEEKVFEDLAYTLTNVTTGQLQTVLNQAAGKGMELISLISSWKGRVKDSREPIDLDKEIADEINFVETELLKRHGISKRYSLMFKNSPKTKAYKADWLEYIEKVEDTEGDVMHLQYIYELVQIKVLNEYAFHEYIKAHYPSETDSFNFLENEQAYHSKLLDYVVDNAQKKQNNYLKNKQDKKDQLKDGGIELMMSIGLSEEEAVAYVSQWDEEEAYNKGNEPSPYIALLESDQYVECIRKFHIKLHSISINESTEIKAVKHIIDDDRRKELERLGLSNAAEKETVNYQESSLDAIEKQEELIIKEQNKKHANQAFKENVVENIEQKGEIRGAKPNGKSLKPYNEEEEEDRDIEQMKLVDAVIRELKMDVTVEEGVAEFKMNCNVNRNKKGRNGKSFSRVDNLLQGI